MRNSKASYSAYSLGMWGARLSCTIKPKHSWISQHIRRHRQTAREIDTQRKYWDRDRNIQNCSKRHRIPEKLDWLTDTLLDNYTISQKQTCVWFVVVYLNLKDSARHSHTESDPHTQRDLHLQTQRNWKRETQFTHRHRLRHRKTYSQPYRHRKI